MTAGIKIYNQKGQLGIDAKYRNIACHRVLNPDGTIFKQFTESVQDFAVHVHELLDAATVQVTNGVSRLQQQRRGKDTFGNLRGEPEDGGHIYGKEYVFGVPMLDSPTVSAAMKIYNPDSGALVFDSRLPYLNIIGQVTNGMALDPRKKYGILTTTPVNFQRRGWNRSRKSWEYDNWYYDDFQAFCVSGTRYLSIAW